MRILAVDDDPVFLDILKVNLNKIGYDNIVVAENADSAIEHISKAQSPFDIFLLDIQMPGKNGIELCRLIRTMPIYRNSPILMITAVMDANYVDKAFFCGATDYFNKPLEFNELRFRMNSMQSLIVRSQKTSQLQNQLDDFSSGRTADCDFDDAIILEDVDGLNSFLAMENYMLRLGATGRLKFSIIGFHVDNAKELFAYHSNQDFRDIMSMVAEAIWHGSSELSIFSYAGEGNFVALANRVLTDDKSEMQLKIEEQIRRSDEAWNLFECSVPIVSVGEPIKPRLLSLASPAETLFEAIELAVQKRTPVREGWFASLARM